VAGITLALRARAGLRGMGLPKQLSPFACEKGGEIRLALTAEPPPQPDSRDLLFDSGAVWKVHRTARGVLYTFRTSAFDPPVYKAVAIDRGLKEGVLYFPPQDRRRRPRHALEFPLDELLFQHRFAQEGAAEVHACGLLREGRTVLFCGVSGAGKTTTALLWKRARPRVTVLSDDRIVIDLRRRRVWGHGTPWHGEGHLSSPRGAPLAAIFFLRHATRTRVVPVDVPQAAARLFARTFPPLWDGAAIDKVLRTCAAAAAAVPCFELRFKPDASAIDAVEDVLRREV
jgi:hypothetical protein